MRSAAAVLLFAAIIGVTAVTALTDRQQFEAWKTKYDKDYDSVEEEADRFDAFRVNLAAIEKHNAAGSKYAMELNAFADMSAQEFASTRLMYPHDVTRMHIPLPNRARARPHHGSHARRSSAAAIPSSFDWAAASVSPKVVTPVRDQGSTGTCWAFSTAQNIEGQWARAKNIDAFELSVEQIVDCDNSTSPNGDATCGVFGGWPYLAYQWIMAHGGLETEQQYPYCCGTGACYPCDAPGTNLTACGPPPPSCNITQNQCGHFDAAATIRSWTAISTNEATIAEELVSRGPLSVLLDADLLQFYSKGIFNPGAWCSSTNLDHAVLLTGYGSENGTDYWVVKNSWGASWGMDGYFWIIRGTGECGINAAVTCAEI